MTQALSIEQHQQEQREHPLFPVRVVARGWGHAGYTWFAVTSDGAALCRQCVRDNYAQIIRAIRGELGSGWQVVAIGNDSELEEPEYCDQCAVAFGNWLEPLG